MYEENDLEERSFNPNTTMPLGSEPHHDPFNPSTNFPNTSHLTPSIILGEAHSSINLNEHDGGGYLHKELPTNKSWSMTPQEQIHGEDQQIDHLHRNLLDLSILQNCSSFSFASSFPYLSQGNVLSSSSSSSLGCSAGIGLHTSLDTHQLIDPSPCDPSLLPMNLPPHQDPSLLLRDLSFHHLPMSDHHYILGCGPGQQGVTASSGINSSLVFGDNSGSIGVMGMMMEEDHGGDRVGTPSQDGGDVFEFACSGRGRKESMKFRKSYVTEKERRITMKEMFNHLRTLIPNPSKDDRASIVADAIDYIKELNRSVKELKILKERKRCLRQQKLKRFKANGEGNNNINDTNYAPNGGEANVDRLKDAVKSEELDHELFAENGSALRSSWLQRKFRDTEVDVRIVDDEVTIKLVQRKKIVNCLLCVSRALDELQLDLHHVAGGHVGDYCSFMFNSKISEGSSVYASAIANKLIEVVDKQYSSIPSTSSFLL